MVHLKTCLTRTNVCAFGALASTPTRTYVSVPLLIEVSVVGETSLHDVHTVVATRLDVRYTATVRTVPHLRHCHLTR